MDCVENFAGRNVVQVLKCRSIVSVAREVDLACRPILQLEGENGIPLTFDSILVMSGEMGVAHTPDKVNDLRLDGVTHSQADG